MSLQKSIIGQYLELYGTPTLRVISEQTGIQITRVFRIINGSSMKATEYYTFQKLIQRKLGLDQSLQNLAEKCMDKLSPLCIKEVELFLKRKLNLSELKNSSNTQNTNICIA